MISNNTYYELFASYTVPDPNRVGYWVDLGANSKGKVIKTYNENLKKWVKVTDATSEDAVAPFIGNNGNWWIDNRDTGIFASGRPPFVNQEYADIVVNAINNNSISSDDYNKLSSWAVPVDNIYPYADTLFQGAVARMSILTEDDGVYAHMHMTRTLTNSPLVTYFCLVEIKADLTLTIKEQRQLVLDTSGDGTRFLANDGSYKEIEPGISDAPSDGNLYARKNKAWELLNNSDQNMFPLLEEIGLVLDNGSATEEQYNKILLFYNENKISNGNYEIAHASFWSLGKFYLAEIRKFDTFFSIDVSKVLTGSSQIYSYSFSLSEDLSLSIDYSNSYHVESHNDGLTISAISSNSNFEYKDLSLLTSGDGTKFLADNGDYAEINVPTKLSELDNDTGFVGKESTGYIFDDNIKTSGNVIAARFIGLLQDAGSNAYLLLDEDGSITTYNGNDDVSLALTVNGDGTKYLADDGEYKEINLTNSYIIDWLSFNSDTGTITQAQCDELWSAIESGKSIYVKLDNATPYGNLFCPVVISYGVNSSFLYIEFESHETNADEEWERRKNGYVISKTKLTWTYKNVEQLITTNDISLDDINRLRSYTTATTVASLSTNYESIYVSLTANASLSAASTGAAYNGRTITAYVYTAAARTITIPK